MSTAAWVVLALVGAVLAVLAGLLLAEGVLRLGARLFRRQQRRQMERNVALRIVAREHAHRSARWIARCRCGAERNNETGAWGPPDLFAEPGHVREVQCPRCTNLARRGVAS